MATPAPEIASSASGNTSVAAKAATATPPRAAPVSVARVSPGRSPRRASHRPPTSAPSPKADVIMARPPAPRSNTASAKPGSSSATGRMPAATTSVSNSNGPMPACLAAKRTPAFTSPRTELPPRGRGFDGKSIAASATRKARKLTAFTANAGPTPA